VSQGRVLIVTHYWPPHVGGIETVAVEQATRLAARGWQVQVATSRLRGDQARERYGPVEVARFRCVNVLERLWSVPVPLVSPTMLFFLWRRARLADVVVAHGHVYIGTLFAALAARLTKRPFVLVQHAPFIDYGRGLNVLERAVDRMLGRRIIRSARTVIAVSDFTADFVRSLVPDAPIEMVRSGVDHDRFAAAVGARSPRPHPTVLTVRRLVPRNGVDSLVEAWRLAGLGAGAELVIGGAGPEIEDIQRLAAGDPSIRIMGYVPDDDLPTLYQDADLFVLPSRSGEGFGLVALEAMASGLPVLATSSGGVVDIVKDGVNGRLVPPNDVPALAEALHQLVDDGVMRSELAEGARRTAEASTWDASIDLLAAVLLGAMARASPGPGHSTSDPTRPTP
jgi:glycosyltransferase involved in cell wall biosynthesis